MKTKCPARAEWERIAGLIGDVARAIMRARGYEGLTVEEVSIDEGDTCVTFYDSHDCGGEYVDIDTREWGFVEREAAGNPAWREEYRAEIEADKAAAKAAKKAERAEETRQAAARKEGRDRAEYKRLTLKYAKTDLATRLASTLEPGPVLADPGGEERVAGENDPLEI